MVGLPGSAEYAAPLSDAAIASSSALQVALAAGFRKESPACEWVELLRMAWKGAGASLAASGPLQCASLASRLARSTTLSGVLMVF